MKIRFAAPLIAVSLLALAACTAPSPAPPPASPAAPAAEGPLPGFRADWAAAPLWDDGHGEVAFYDARRPVYGRPTDYPAVLITVKEELDAAAHVKADAPLDGRALVAAMKLLADHRFAAPTMPYRFTFTAHVRRDDPARLIKLVFGAQEWCGITFKQMDTRGTPAELRFHSYFDGEGSGTHVLDLRPGDLAEDQLPLALRGLAFAEGLEVRARIFPTLGSLRIPGPPRPVAATLRVAGQEAVETARGREAAWRVEVEWEGAQQTWWLAVAAPHIVLAMESSDGRNLRLRRVERTAYWSEPVAWQ